MSSVASRARAAQVAAVPLIVFYDGVCGFCDRIVQFVLERDTRDRFRFAALQSDFAGEVLRRHGKNPTELDTMYVVEGQGTPNERVLSQARAGLRILETLGGVWSVAYLLRLFPAFILNVGYRALARVRYRIFGRLDACRVPTAGERAKFLG